MNQTEVSTFPLYAKSIIGVLATCVSTATLGGNIVVLMAFFVESALRIPSNYFIASLAVTDMLIGLFSMNLFIMYQLMGYWPLGQILCDIWLSLDFSACLTSQYTVFLITVDRYCSVKIPVSYRNWRTIIKVRCLICASWLFPAGLFTPVILGWKQLTSEPPRGEGKCDVSFTYYPIFNTTLIIGYFWTTLIVMCSLYFGIYRVARRLQKKATGVSEKLAALFNRELSQDGGDEEIKEGDGEIACSTTKKTSDSQSPVSMTTREESKQNHANTKRAGTLNQTSQALSGVTKGTRKNEVEGLGSDEIGIRTDDESRYSPLRTMDERSILATLKTPKAVLSDLECDNLPSFSELDEPPSITCIPDSLQHQAGMAGILELNAPVNDNKPFDENNQKIILPDVRKASIHNRNDDTAKWQLQNTNSKDDTVQMRGSNSESEQNFFATSVNKYIPSPELPLMMHAESPRHGHAAYEKLESPVWVENVVCRKAPKFVCYCNECCTPKGSSLNGYQAYPNVYWYPFPRKFFGNLSPTQTDNFSEFSSSGQQDSSDYTQNQPVECLCAYHANFVHFDAMTYLSEYTDSSSSYSDRAPWYRRFFFRLVYQCRSQQLRTPCPKNVSKSFANCSNAMWTRLHDFAHRLRKKVHCMGFQQEISPTTEIMNRKRRQTVKARAQSMRASWGHIRTLSALDSHNRRHARKALRTISFILGAFIMCWTPYHIIMMIKGFCDDLTTQTSCVSTHLYNLTYWLCYMNSPINPFCYALSNALFRRTFFRILRGDFQRR